MFSVDMKKLLNGCSNPFTIRTRFRYPSFESDDFGSDEFRMYSFKIKKCPINRTHDWTVCPYAHRGERARRRDPRLLPYVALACPEFRATGGVCPRGDLCPYAHGVFEYWLHPAKYRTRVCTSGEQCTRPVCFFAHSPDELRLEHPGHLSKWSRLALKADADARATAHPSDSDGLGLGLGLESSQTMDNFESHTGDMRINDDPKKMLESLKGLRINDMPDFDWISDLLAG